MDERIKQAAESGDITALHQLIGKDANLLDHIDEKQYVRPPLHIAAFVGAHPICHRGDGINALICLETKSRWV